ncbi:enoyl-CoA hydratase/isomerase family protein [Emcibacter nanhaiensis]|uniref:Enoyl-CoA hydratase/isomerase family protein n=1 Tax=Emcibacter nanhaiensis TaxID=1505037 RepID=A0A501PG77_9PROT|nr:enoyl-CoA hydratase-related protein [Emcibacter nanhaiensis]TPD59195.1 enoyl-CoA hydratase/isomerase family protein [Emcibacter nanhaiensis]
MAHAEIYLRITDNIAWLVLNRPDKKNALDKSMWEKIPRLVEEATRESHVRVLIIRSEDSGFFSAGADISEFTLFKNDKAARDENRKAIRAACRALEQCPLPTIAMIQGACVGGGCMLALCCDIRLGNERSKYGITPAKLGLVYGLGDTRRLVDLVGPARAKQILYTAGIFTSDHALRIGLVNDIFPDDKLEEETLNLAEQMMANSGYSLRHLKQNIARVLNGEREDDEASEALFNAAFDGPDHQEGVDAFLNKRKPQF